MAPDRAHRVNDFGLDLAVIGNGQTAALVDPTARIVWWCYPRFDSDPVFSRLLAGSEEKGFSDVVLDVDQVRSGFAGGYHPNLGDPRHLRVVVWVG